MTQTYFGTDLTTKLPTLVGVLIALTGPLLVLTPWMRIIGDPQTIGARVAGQIYYLSIVGILLGVVHFWEKRPLSSIGIKVPSLGTFGWAILSVLVLTRVIVPIAIWFVSLTGLPLFEKGLQTVTILPVWFRFLAIVVTGGIFEEVVYRGYLVERLSELTGSYWIGSFVALSVFSWMHYPLWGLGPVLTFYVTGGFLTAIYVWKRDLLLNMTCHIITDFLGLIFFAIH